METSDPAQPAVPASASAAPEATPTIKEKPDEATAQPVETDPPHESGYGFGV